MNRMYYIDNAICIKNITHEWYTAITYHAPESIPVHSCQPLWQMEGLHILDTGHLINADQRCDTNCSKCSRKTIIAYLMNKKKKKQANFWVFFFIQEGNKPPQTSRNYREDPGEEQVTQLKRCHCAMAMGCPPCQKVADNTRATA